MKLQNLAKEKFKTGLSASIGIGLILKLLHINAADLPTLITAVALLVWAAVHIYFTQKRHAKYLIQQNIKQERQNGIDVTDALWQLVYIEDARPGGANYFNQRWADYAGVAPTMNPEFWQSILHPDDHAVIVQSYAKKQMAALPYEFNYRIKRHDGIFRWHHAQSAPVKNQHGQVIKWITTSTDIEDQRTAEAERNNLIAKLEEKTSIFESVLEHMPSGVILADESRTILLKNKKMIEFFKMDDRYRIGSLETFNLDLTPTSFDELPIPTTLRTRKQQIQMKYVKVPGESMRLFQFNSSPVFSKHGKLIGAVAIIDDVTQNKLDEEERSKTALIEQNAISIKKSKEVLERLVENIPYMIFLKDAETLQYIQVNKAVTEMLQLPANYLIGKTAQQLYPREQAIQTEESDREALRSGKVSDIPQHAVTFKHLGTRIYNTRKFVLEMEDGKKVLVGVSHDITEILQARDEAQLAAKLKSEFLATMSHEIRTPLNGVLGMSELVLEGPLDNQQKRYMQILRDSGKSLLAIVNDILDFSKVEAGQVTLEEIPFSIRDIFESQLQGMKLRAQAKKVSFDYAFDERIPGLVSGDPSRITQVLTNLISNSIKFTSEGSISLKVELTDSCPEKVKLRFSVKDTGIGISNEEKSRLFKPFVQGDGSMARRFGGTGLGLSISKKLIELMQGDINVESVKGEGSTFWFSLTLKVPSQFTVVPLRRDEANFQPGPVNFKMPPAGKGKNILLAEDNDTNQVVAQAMLTRLGYTTHIVENGLEAIEALKNFEYDLVLMDCQMPELDGYDATKKIRENEKDSAKRTPIIAITANARPQDREKCLSVGMDDFISKPITKAKLSEILEAWLKPAEDF